MLRAHVVLVLAPFQHWIADSEPLALHRHLWTLFWYFKVYSEGVLIQHLAQQSVQLLGLQRRGSGVTAAHTTRVEWRRRPQRSAHKRGQMAATTAVAGD
jgi:hypothetical protein